jgi:hypothetical protein
MARILDKNTPFSRDVADIVPLTDNSGGTAGNTIVAVPAAYSQADFRAIIASLTAKINALLAERNTNN